MAIVDCPRCRGNGFASIQAESFIDPACGMCFGAGIIDTDLSCKCGKPAVRRVKDSNICGNSKMCVERAEGKQVATDANFCAY